MGLLLELITNDKKELLLKYNKSKPNTKDDDYAFDDENDFVNDIYMADE